MSSTNKKKSKFPGKYGRVYESVHETVRKIRNGESITDGENGKRISRYWDRLDEGGVESYKHLMAGISSLIAKTDPRKVVRMQYLVNEVKCLTRAFERSIH